jgi:hypothetical protein
MRRGGAIREGIAPYICAFYLPPMTPHYYFEAHVAAYDFGKYAYTVVWLPADIKEQLVFPKSQQCASRVGCNPLLDCTMYVQIPQALCLCPKTLQSSNVLHAQKVQSPLGLHHFASTSWTFCLCP